MLKSNNVSKKNENFSTIGKTKVSMDYILCTQTLMALDLGNNMLGPIGTKYLANVLYCNNVSIQLISCRH